MSQRRDHALALLASIRDKLRPESANGWHAVRFNSEERDFLLDVCERALEGGADPLRTQRGAGGQSERGAGLAEAEIVHRRVKQLGTLRAACETVGREFHRDGSKSGAVEKNYKVYRAQLEAADRFYAARNAGREPDLADLEAILNPRVRGK